jgi:hypothetical protein
MIRIVAVTFSLLALGLTAMIPSTSASLACASEVCAGTGDGGSPIVCRYIGGTYPYECVGLINGCIYEWHDKSADGSPSNGNDFIVSIACL